MSSTIEPLVLDLVEWIAKEPRSYIDVMDAWRTSCPRLTVWEDAVDRRLVECVSTDAHGVLVKVTTLGRSYLAEHGRLPELTDQPRTAAPELATASRHT